MDNMAPDTHSVVVTATTATTVVRHDAEPDDQPSAPSSSCCSKGGGGGHDAVVAADQQQHPQQQQRIGPASAVSFPFGVAHRIPPGDVVTSFDIDHTTLVDEDDRGMTIHDRQRRLQWSFRFFENLHMDLSVDRADHLRSAMER
jgi:hypothetical protein